MKILLKSKIHKAIITEANLDYIGSITIDKKLMELVGIVEYEKVLVVDNTNGARLETYVIEGKKDSGVICMNGAASHLMKKGDEIIIMAFEITENSSKPKQILVNKNNKFIKFI